MNYLYWKNQRHLKKNLLKRHQKHQKKPKKKLQKTIILKKILNKKTLISCLMNVKMILKATKIKNTLKTKNSGCREVRGKNIQNISRKKLMKK